MGKNTNKKMVPKDGASNTKSSGTLFSVYFSIRRDMKLPKDIPSRSLKRYCKILKDKRIIKKTGYATWGIDNAQEAIKFAENHYSKHGANKSLLPATKSPKQVNIHSLPVIDKRGHKAIFTITTPKLVLGKLKTYFNYKKRGYAKLVNGGRAGNFLQLHFQGAIFQIYENHIVIRFNKSFFAEHHIDTQEQAQAHFKAVLSTFERNMPISIRIGKELLVKASMEFEKVNSEFAKYCFEHNLDIRFTSGDFRYWQDKSGGTPNEEGNQADIMDNIEPYATVGWLKKVSEHKRRTGRDWGDDIEKNVSVLTQSVTLMAKVLTPPQPLQDIEETKRKHKELPSYFG